ncbi:porin [Marinomonas epiphytica]
MKATKLVTAFGLTAIAAAVSTSSYALDLVKTDDLTLNMNGDIDLKILHNSGNDQRTEVEANFDDLDFDFKWKIDDTVTFIAATDWTVESDKGNDVKNDQTWVGVKIGDFMARAGYQEDAIDPLGIDTFEIAALGRASGEQDGSGTKFAESLVLGYDHDDFDLLASYAIASESEGTSDEDDYEGEVPKRLALYGKTKIGDFQFEAGIGQEENFEQETKVNFWQAQVEYFAGPATLGALYSSMSVDQVDPSDTDFDSTGLEFNVSYKVNDKLNVYAGYETIDNGVAGEEKYVGKGVGASYAFSKLVKLYVEAGTEKGTYISGKSTGPKTSTKEEQSVAGMLLSVDF